MTAFDLLLIVLIAIGSFWAGFQLGRASATRQNAGGTPRHVDTTPAEDAPDDLPLPGPGDPPMRRRTSTVPPPAASGGPAPTTPTAAAPRAGGAPPRKSSTPPPAAAGLLDKNE